MNKSLHNKRWRYQNWVRQLQRSYNIFSLFQIHSGKLSLNLMLHQYIPSLQCKALISTCLILVMMEALVDVRASSPSAHRTLNCSRVNSQQLVAKWLMLLLSYLEKPLPGQLPCGSNLHNQQFVRITVALLQRWGEYLISQWADVRQLAVYFSWLRVL